MIFGKHINVYYRKYALALLTGLLALFTVDYLQLKAVSYTHLDVYKRQA